MKKLFSIAHKNIWCECKYEEGAANPYRLYKVSWKMNSKSYPTKSCKLVAKYADLQSVLYHLATQGI